MLIFRWVVLLMLAAGLFYLAMYVGTGQPRYRLLGMRIISTSFVKPKVRARAMSCL
jgi:hypothetical protein